MKFKHLFYRVKAVLATFLAPTPALVIKSLAATAKALDTSVKAYNNALNAETGVRLESFNREYDAQVVERKLRDASYGRTDNIRDAQAHAERVSNRIKDLLA